MRILDEVEIAEVEGGALPVVAALLVHVAVRYAAPRLAAAAGEAFVAGVATGAVVEAVN
jgi:hypothetical protein